MPVAVKRAVFPLINLRGPGGVIFIETRPESDEIEGVTEGNPVDVVVEDELNVMDGEFGSIGEVEVGDDVKGGVSTEAEHAPHKSNVIINKGMKIRNVFSVMFTIPELFGRTFYTKYSTSVR